MAQLAAFILHLRPLHQDTIPVWLGRATHAWYLHSLEGLDARLSAAVHGEGGHQAKPITLSNLYGLRGREVGHLSPQQVYSLRLTTLHADVTHLTLHGLIPLWLKSPITLHDQPFHVEAVVCDAAQDERSGQADYAELLASPASRRLGLTFGSPTTFKQTPSESVWGATQPPDLYQPWPDPKQVIASLQSRWAQFSPLALPCDLRPYSEGLQVESYRLQTQRISFERAQRGSLVGFTGQVVYRVAAGLTTPVRQALAGLFAFAKYSGLGYKTTMGLGQAWPSHPQAETVLSTNT